MSMSEWAKREVEAAVKRERESEGVAEGEFSYGGSCYESALKAFNSLCEDGHSGMSIGFTKNILNRLIDGNPLSVITGEDDEWNENLRGENHPCKVYQNKRMSSLFKDVYPDGTVKYTCNGNYFCIDINNGISYTGGGARDIIDALYPITMPYYPTAEKIKLYTEDFLVDPKNGDYDTKGYFYLIHPIDGRVEVNKFFAEVDGEFKEITKDEYDQKKLVKIEVK